MSSFSPSVADIQEILQKPSRISSNSFGILKEISRLANDFEHENIVQELVLRCLEHRDKFRNYQSVLDSLVRRVGLYPYLSSEDLGLKDLLAYEAHRPEGLGEDIVFHRSQAKVYLKLINGENIILSAPTSYGKSLIIDALIASNRYRNIVIVVPTIALIDETRRRLQERFGREFAIITHSTQKAKNKNIYIFTQERIVDFDELLDIDLTVIDEFYKLSPRKDNDDRYVLLNQAFYSLQKKSKQFYLLGPDIQAINESIENKLNCKFLSEPFHTVVTELHRVSAGDDEFASLAQLCNRLDDLTIIFCRSPARAASVAKYLIDAEIGHEDTALVYAADWVDKHYNPDWHFAKALRRGIGVHHGRIPRALSQYVVRKFNDGDIRFLICTSTLIEGVNTKAKNIVVFDHTLARSPLDLFTFNNIKGRSGRMFSHFVGHVYIFHSPPTTSLPYVDIPAYSQNENAPDHLLIQIDEDDLTDEAKNRLEKYRDQPYLDVEVLKANSGVDLQAQVDLARTIYEGYSKHYRMLSWKQLPTYDQLKHTTKLMWDFFGGSRLGSGSIRSYNQLTFLINRLRDKPSAKTLIESNITYQQDSRKCVDIDDCVQSALDFLRLWANFHFPRLLRCINSIQTNVFTKLNLSPGNYEYFANKVECFFMDPSIIALDEYGVPLEVARRFESYFSTDGDIDLLLSRLRNFPTQQYRLSPFEVELIEDAKSWV